MPGLAQRRNVEQVRLLSSDLQPRYEPNFAWKSAASCLLALPMLRGAWVTSVNSSGDWYDLSGLGKTLTYNGNPTFNYAGLVPYWDYDGTGDYHSRADEADLDIIGTESYVVAAKRGLTLGGWFNFDGTTNGWRLMSKGDAATAAGSSYILQFTAGNVLAFRVFSGVNTYAATSTVVVSTGTWYFAAGRYVPSTTCDIYVNAVKDTNAVAIPASINNTAAPFNVAAENNGTAGTLMDGRAALCFLCAAALSDAQVGSVFQQTRAAFGV